MKIGSYEALREDTQVEINYSHSTEAAGALARSLVASNPSHKAVLSQQCRALRQKLRTTRQWSHLQR
jgi:hypothetical protein